jgi:hypothetical protein
MDVVMVEFPVGSDKTDECVAALNELMTSVVAKQTKFHGATICVEAASGSVFNAMRWETTADFIEFRDSHQDVIQPALAKFNPKPHMLSIACEIEAQN